MAFMLKSSMRGGKPNPRAALKKQMKRGGGKGKKALGGKMASMSRDQKITEMEDMLGDEKF